MPNAPAVFHDPAALAAARGEAAACDMDDAAGGRPTETFRAPDHSGLAAENTGGIDFTALLEAEFHPAPPQDRIEHPWLSPPALDEAAEALIATLPAPVGRHNRYRPVPGEDALRTDDLHDFVKWYGHEYQILVFRAADVRTASMIDLEVLTAAGAAEGASVIWDWTGAADWIPTVPFTDNVAAVYWSTHHSLIDGRRIDAGIWQPGDGHFPPPLAGNPLPSDASARAGRLAEFARRVVSDALKSDTSMRVLHPGQAATSIPLLVLEAPANADLVAEAFAAGPGFRSVVRYGERVVALPDPDAKYVDVVERVAAVRS